MFKIISKKKIEEWNKKRNSLEYEIDYLRAELVKESSAKDDCTRKNEVLKTCLDSSKKEQELIKKERDNFFNDSNKKTEEIEKLKKEKALLAAANGGYKSRNNKAIKERNDLRIVVKEKEKQIIKLTEELSKYKQEQSEGQLVVKKLQLEVEKYKRLKDPHAVEKYEKNHKDLRSTRRRNK